MSTNKQSLVPNAREALNKFKMEAANEVGVNLEAGLQRRPDQQAGRFRGRPDGQEDDRSLRERHEVIAASLIGCGRRPPAVPYGLRGTLAFPRKIKKIKNLFTTLH